MLGRYMELEIALMLVECRWSQTTPIQASGSCSWRPPRPYPELLLLATTLTCCCLHGLQRCCCLHGLQRCCCCWAGRGLPLRAHGGRLSWPCLGLGYKSFLRAVLGLAATSLAPEGRRLELHGLGCQRFPAQQPPS